MRGPMPRRLMTCYHLLQDGTCLIPLDRDTERCPRTRVFAIITRRSAHCSLLRTHKPGSPLLPCAARARMPLRRFLNPWFDCSSLKSYPRSPSPRTLNQYPEIPKFLDPGMSSLTTCRILRVSSQVLWSSHVSRQEVTVLLPERELRRVQTS